MVTCANGHKASVLADQIGRQITHNIVIDGNSIAAATVNAIGEALIYVGFCSGCYTNVSLSGKSTTALVLSAPTNVDPLFNEQLPGRNICILWEGTNDLYLHAAMTGIEAYNKIKEYGINRWERGFKFIPGTLLPRTGDGANQEDRRLVCNALLRQAWADREYWIANLADPGADPIMGQLTTTSKTTYYSDGTHPTTLGHSICRPYFRDAIRAVIASED